MNTPSQHTVHHYDSVQDVSDSAHEDAQVPVPDHRTKAQLRKDIREAQRKMQLAAKEMNFLQAAKYRDEIKSMQALLETARGE